jgi:hypothetical protein
VDEVPQHPRGPPLCVERRRLTSSGIQPGDISPAPYCARLCFRDHASPIRRKSHRPRSRSYPRDGPSVVEPTFDLKHAGEAGVNRSGPPPNAAASHHDPPDRLSEPVQTSSKAAGSRGSNQQPTTRPSRMWYRPTVDQRRWTPATTAVPSVRAAMRSPSPTSTSPGCIRKVRSTRSRAAGSTPIRCRSPGSHPQSRYGRGRANGHRRPAAPGPARRHRRRRKPAGPLEPSQQLDGFGSIHDLADEGAERAELDLLFQEAESPGP